MDLHRLPEMVVAGAAGVVTIVVAVVVDGVFGMIVGWAGDVDGAMKDANSLVLAHHVPLGNQTIRPSSLFFL